MSRPPRRQPPPSDPQPTNPAPDTAASPDSAERSPNGGESRYRPRPPARPDPPPLTVHIELRLVGGPEGRQLRIRQAAAIREALRWFAEHRTDTPPTETP